MQSLMSVSEISNIKTMVKEKEGHAGNDLNANDSGILVDNRSHGLISSQKLTLEPISVSSCGGNNGQNSSKLMKPEQPLGQKGRGDFGPLIDLHMDYDEGSLPSPTRDNPPSLPIPPPMPIQKTRAIGDEVIISHSMPARQEETEDAALHPYVTDAVRAVSSYQQKFGRTSFLSSNRLPSPTPSEEREDGDGDSYDEVSSSAAGSARMVNSNVGLQPTVSTTTPLDGLNGQGPVLGKTVGLLGPGSNPDLRPIKSRDPRLRFANLNVNASDHKEGPLPVDNILPKNELFGGIMSSRKNKVDESVLDGHALKKRRNSLTDPVLSNATRVISGSGGWLEDSNNLGSVPGNKEQLTENMEVDVRKSENGEVGSSNRNDINANLNGTNGGGQQFPVTANGLVSLPSLLKDIAVNPTMLMHLIKMEQERLAAEGRQKPTNTAQPPSCSSLSSGSESVFSSQPSLLGQVPAVSQSPSQTTSMVRFAIWLMSVWSYYHWSLQGLLCACNCFLHFAMLCFFQVQLQVFFSCLLLTKNL